MGCKRVWSIQVLPVCRKMMRRKKRHERKKDAKEKRRERKKDAKLKKEDKGSSHPPQLRNQEAGLKRRRKNPCSSCAQPISRVDFGYPKA